MIMNEAYTSMTQRIAVEHTDCALVQDLLPLYLDNEVSPESHARIAEHIQRCERCANYLAGARSVRGQLLRGQQTAGSNAGATPAVSPTQHGGSSTTGSNIGRILLMAAGAIGMLILVPVLIPIAIVAAIPIGLFVLIRTIWAKSQTQAGGSAASIGANRVFWTALLSILGVFVCGGLMLGGVAAIADGWYLQDKIFGIFLALIGFGGLVRLNQRRGWLPQYAAPQMAQQLITLAVISGAVLAGLFVIQTSLSSMPPLLLLGVIAGLVWWWRNK